MGNGCAWRCILFRQMKYVLLCAILLSACGNEGAQKGKHLTDRSGNISCVLKILTLFLLKGFVFFICFSAFDAARLTLTHQIGKIK